MLFPSILQICSTQVMAISDQASFGEAVDQMLGSTHRNVIIDSGHYYHILFIQDVIRFQLEGIGPDTPLHQLSLKRLPTVDSSANILDCIGFVQEKVEYLGVLDEEGKLCGLLSHTDIVNSIDPEILMEHYSVGDVVKNHRSDLWTQQSMPVEQVIRKMVAHHSDCALALSDNRELQGIFTTKDILRLYEQKQDLKRPLSDYMSHPVETVVNTTPLKDAVAFVKARPYKRVIVVNQQGQLEGMVLQRELIAMTYNMWATLMRQFQEELQQLNQLLENKNRHYQSLAAKDALTGLFNRHKFSELLASELASMKLLGNSMGLIMFDIDHFKAINDEHGHNCGDQVLVEVAAAVTGALRQTDVVCRWGGEEFVVLLSAANGVQTETIAEQLRQSISNTVKLNEQSVTASFGVTEVHQDDTLETMVGRADGALYQAKRQGRNRVCRAR